MTDLHDKGREAREAWRATHDLPGDDLVVWRLVDDVWSAAWSAALAAREESPTDGKIQMYNLGGEYPDLPTRLLAWPDYCVQVERADEAEAALAARDTREDAERELEPGDRGNPQRFTLTGMRSHGRGADVAWTLPQIDPDLERDEIVHVREDIITAADVEAVARREALHDGLKYDAIKGSHQEVYQDKAKRILALVLGSDKGDTDG